MKVKVSKIAADLFRSVSPVREIMSFADSSKLEEYGVHPKDLISFAGGWVNHNTPNKMKEAYLSIINDAEAFHFSGGYSPTLGERVFKEAVVEFEKYLFNMDGIVPENIIVGQSSTQLTSLMFKVLLNPGDKICVLDPSYCNFPLQISTSSPAKIIRFTVINKENFEYIANETTVINKFREFLLQERPKIVLLVSPDNPTSQILSDEFVLAAYDSVKSYGGTIAIDFAYKTLVFNKTPEYFSWAPNGNFISIHSNSKWCRGLGRRLGWIEAPKYIAESFESFQNSTILCPDRLHQMAIAKYITEAIQDNSLRKYVHETRELYKKTAGVLTKAIQDYMKLPFFLPKGGLYTCVQVPMNSAEFVENLLKSTGVLAVPGWGFGRTLNKAVRLSYGPLVYRHNLIRDGIEYAGEYIKKL